jgi:GxxExxY protein
VSIELSAAGLDVEAQKSLKVFYKGQLAGDLVADIIVNNTVIVELKSVSKIIKAQEVQLVNYLVSTNKLVCNYPVVPFDFAQDRLCQKYKFFDD